MNSRKTKINPKQNFYIKKNLEFSFPEKDENMLSHYKRQVSNIKTFIPRELNWNLQRLKNETISSYCDLNYTNNNNDILFPKNYCLNSKLDLDQFSCNYCEEYYKLVLLKNVPLRLFNCAHCRNKINQESLIFFSKKYEKEMKEEIQKTINSQFNINSSYSFNNSLSTNPLINNTDSIDTHNFSIKKSSNYEINSTIEYKKDYKIKKEMEDVEEIINEEALDSNNKRDRKETKKDEFPFYKKEEEINGKAEEKFQENHKNNISRKDDLNKNLLIYDFNLADTFKDKKKEMIEKLEKRKHIKVAKSTHEKEHIIGKKLLKKSSDKNERKSDINMSTLKKTRNESSSETLNKLAIGENVKLSKKEVKDSNNRLLIKLPEVISEEKDENRKLGQVKRTENTKSLDNVNRRYN